MARELPRGTSECGPDYERLAAESRARALHRRILRELIKNEIRERPLGWRRRRELVRLAERLGLDAFEGRLLIRAVEYECGYIVPEPAADVDAQVAEAYLASSRSTAALGRFIVIVIGVLLLNALVIGRFFAPR